MRMKKRITQFIECIQKGKIEFSTLREIEREREKEVKWYMVINITMFHLILHTYKNGKVSLFCIQWLTLAGAFAGRMNNQGSAQTPEIRI